MKEVSWRATCVAAHLPLAERIRRGAPKQANALFNAPPQSVSGSKPAECQRES
jgi:hypothetical protein